LTTLTDIQISSPYHPSLALNGGGFPEGFSCHHLNPIRYIVSGLRTDHTARGKHARVGTGRNIPGTPGIYLSTLKLCDFVSHPNAEVTGRCGASAEHRSGELTCWIVLYFFSPPCFFGGGGGGSIGGLFTPPFFTLPSRIFSGLNGICLPFESLSLAIFILLPFHSFINRQSPTFD